MAIPEYAEKFDKAYREPPRQSLGDALAAYQQVLVTGNSPFDQWFYGRQQHAISAMPNWAISFFWKSWMRRLPYY